MGWTGFRSGAIWSLVKLRVAWAATVNTTVEAVEGADSVAIGLKRQDSFPVPAGAGADRRSLAHPEPEWLACVPQSPVPVNAVSWTANLSVLPYPEPQ